MPTGHVTGHMGPTTVPPSSHCVIIVPETPYLLSPQNENQDAPGVPAQKVGIPGFNHQLEILGLCDVKLYCKIICPNLLYYDGLNGTLKHGYKHH